MRKCQLTMLFPDWENNHLSYYWGTQQGGYVHVTSTPARWMCARDKHPARWICARDKHPARWMCARDKHPARWICARDKHPARWMCARDKSLLYYYCYYYYIYSHVKFIVLEGKKFIWEIVLRIWTEMLAPQMEIFQGMLDTLINFIK